MTKPIVTIAIPAYKPTFLKEAIDSALRQTYTNIELVIVNDDSPYDLDALVSQYTDSRIRYYKNDTNLGSLSIVHNWNRCLSYARGEYFVLLCDDDILAPTMVQEMLGLAQKYQSLGCFHARKCNLQNDGSTKDTTIWPEYEDYEKFAEQNFAEQRKHTITEFFYRTRFLTQHGGFVVFPVGYYSDDATILYMAKQQGGMVSSQDILVTFREGNEHISGNDKYALGKAQAIKEYYLWLQQFPELAHYLSEEGYVSIIFIHLYACNWIDKLRILPLIPFTWTRFKSFMYSFITK